MQGDNVEVIFGKDSIELESDYSFSGRGMELSDGVFNFSVIQHFHSTENSNIKQFQFIEHSIVKHFQFIENSILIHLNKTYYQIFKSMMVVLPRSMIKLELFSRSGSSDLKIRIKKF